MSVIRRLPLTILIALVGLVPACITDDQPPPVGDIFRSVRGTVTDVSTSLPLSGVTCFWSDSLPYYETSVTDSTGAYSVRGSGSPVGLPAIGHLTFAKIGYDTLTTPAAALFPDLDTQRCTYDVRMVRHP